MASNSTLKLRFRTIDVEEDRNTGVLLSMIRYARVEDAETAIDTMDGLAVNASTIRIVWSHKCKPQGELKGNRDGYRVRLSGFDLKIDLLSDDVDRKMLKQRLEGYGEIR